ncbi:MAG: thermonuclease family protein, partial [Geminicoccaceae bacterium]
SRRVRIVSYLETDAYGRLLARLYDRDGRDVSEVLIAEGHARPLGSNERRQPWCPVQAGG